MKNIGITAFFAAVILGVSLLSVLAQSTSGQSPAMPQMSMGGMMETCQQHCDKTSAAVDEITRTIADARASKDVTKLHAALDQVQARVTAIGEQTKQCHDMMAMMQHMMPMQGHGGMKEEPAR